jgi:PhzF family phenazine biosynthesis protein
VTEIVHVDAFAERMFSGNPAAVVLLDSISTDEGWMQGLARETGLPATAFVQPDPGGAYGLRWFSPTNELALCGHGTLASAHVLFERGAPGTDIRFQTRSAGELVATRRDGLVELDFPAVPTQPAQAPRELSAALGADVVNVERGQYDYLVEVTSADEVSWLAPDFVLLRQVETRGVIVTARVSNADADFVSRFFAPRVGFDEDSVTGSAHCALGPYWSARLGKQRMTGIQVSARRGVVHVDVSRAGRVTLGGNATTVMRGRLAGDPIDEWHAVQARAVAGFGDGQLRRVEAPLISIPGPR